MDAKELKTALKAARDSIRAKDFKEALRQCKLILKIDKNNYNALVFVGVAAEGLEQHDQALAAYKRATETDPKQMLAWQGLCGFYEKSETPQHKEELGNVYKKMIELLESDFDKKCDFQLKLSKLYYGTGQTEQAIVICKSALETAGSCQDKAPKIWPHLVELLEQQKQLDEELTSLLLKGYKFMLGSDQKNGDTVKKYLKLLVKTQADPQQIKTECEHFVKNDTENPLPYEILCQLFLDECTTSFKNPQEITEYFSKVEEQSPDSALCHYMKGYIKLHNKEWKASKQLLLAGMDIDPANVTGLYLTAFVYEKMHDFEKATRILAAVQKVLQKNTTVFNGNREDLDNSLMFLKVKSQFGLDGKKFAKDIIDISNQLLSRNFEKEEVLVIQGYTYLQNSDIDNAEKVLKTIDGSGESAVACALEGWIEYHRGNFEKAENSLSKALDSKPEMSMYWSHLGRVYWKLMSGHEKGSDYKEKVLKTFMKAAKLDSFDYVNFLYMGHYYAEVLKDKNNARRCYQKAHELNKTNEEVGTALVDILVSLGEDGMALGILQAITREAPSGSAKWAWLRLGLQQMKQEDLSVAIMSLQKALAADPKDVHVWECLGEAYRSRGSYQSALKAFSRATELNPELIYSYYEIGAIKETLGLYPEAVEAYQMILDSTPNYVPALKGLGETFLRLARQSLHQYFHKKAVSQCQEAIAYLTRASSVRPDLSCLWKLLGDSFTIIHTIPADIYKLEIPGKLLGTSSKCDTVESIDKKAGLALGGRCYGMALKQIPDSSSLWHDLGVSYYAQAVSMVGKESKDLAAKAVQCFQKAITMDPQNYRHWNALGVVCSSQLVQHDALAQHCFIKSIHAEKNNVVAWTNLGVLYLKNHHITQAHEAFKNAQNLEPDYVACWIGQALIAETVGDKDAMDLFRHTTELCNHVEGGIGYAHWVCHTLKDHSKMEKSVYEYSIEQMAAIPAASDALAKYTDRVRDNPTAFNMYGLLLERQGLLQLAVSAFESAYEILKKSSEHIALLDEAKANYVRLLWKVDRSEEALKLVQDGTVSSFRDACEIGLALFKAAKYEESFNFYEKALTLTESDEEKASVYAAMGMAQIKLANVEGAKSALFQCTQMSPPTIHGFKALCGVAAAEQDDVLGSAVVQEMLKTQDFVHHAADVAFLDVQVGNGRQSGRNQLIRAIHTNPDKAILWNHLGEFCLKHYPECSSSAATCAQVAELLSRNEKGDLSVLPLSAILEGIYNKDVSKNSLRLAQKAVFMQPDLLSNWCCLLNAIHAQHIYDTSTDSSSSQKDFKDVLLSLTTHLMSQVEHELGQADIKRSYYQALHVWCVKQYIIALLSVGRQEQAQQFLQQAIWLYEDDPILQSLSALFQDNFKGIRKIAEENNNRFPWQLLANLYLHHGLVQEVEKTWKEAIENISAKDDKLRSCIDLAHFAYCKVLEDNSDSERWTSLFEEAASAVRSLVDKCSVVTLMQGMIALKSDNKRLAKRHLEHVLEAEGSEFGQNLVKKHLLEIYKEKGDEEKLKALVGGSASQDIKVNVDPFEDEG